MNAAFHSTLKFNSGIDPANCQCALCKNKLAFSVPLELAEAFTKGRVVLFVGSGVSTEGRGLLPNTFYEHIYHKIGRPFPKPSFPDVMEEFCRGPNGRFSLVRELKKHFDYVYSHPELYRGATRFHRQLATFFPIDTIITTNWDTYFEDICGATPFVEDKDIALWEVAQRRVLKVHSTIANFGSIIATRSDYTRCAKRLNKGTLGAHLKSLLSTRIFLHLITRRP